MEPEKIKEAVKFAQEEKNKAANDIRNIISDFNDKTGLCLMGNISVDHIQTVGAGLHCEQGDIELEIAF